MNKLILLLMLASVLAVNAFSMTIKNVPFDSMLHLGITSGLGAGVNIGADVIVPVYGIGIGFELEQLVTNHDYEQNINSNKYGFMYKRSFTDNVSLTFHGGVFAFYLPKAISYRDFYTGKVYNLPDDHHGSAIYLGLGLNYKVDEYVITPKISVNNIVDGGSSFQFDLNIGHKL